ncbi:MAG: response regulator [Elusimicrobiales bacterium]|nr:response regulator [Elusimicrobiales bacterium]
MKKKTLTILSIDDNTNYQLIFAKYFTLVGGHKVEVAETGNIGISKASNLKPDIILLDLNMPDMTGYEVISALETTNTTSDIPVIILTGDSVSENSYHSLKLKKNFLQLQVKPVNLERLLKTIESTL